MNKPLLHCLLLGLWKEAAKSGYVANFMKSTSVFVHVF